MKRVLMLLISVFVSCGLQATQQEPEKFYWKGKQSSIYNKEFLRDYLENNKIEIPDQYANSTALWRGYIGTYSIVDNFLTLKDIEVYKFNNTVKDYYLVSIYDKLPGRMKNLRIDWYSGLLILPYGEMIESDDYYLGYAYPHYFVFEISKGKVIKYFDFTLKEFQHFENVQFNAYKKTEQYKKQRAAFLEQQRQFALYQLTEEYKKTAGYNIEKENGFIEAKRSNQEEADLLLKCFMFDNMETLF